MRRLAAIACGAVLAVGGASAWGLWRDARSVAPPAVLRGGVSFAAEEQVSPTRQYSSAGDGPAAAQGTAVQVTLPASVVTQVLLGQPVVWRFDVLGYALGIAGLTYDVSYPTPADNTPFVIDTILEGSSMTVYQAAAGGDCSTPSATTPEANNDVVTIPDQVLQPPGSNPSGADIVQTWCVLLHWEADPSRFHTNAATVTATATNGSTVTSTSLFESYIDYLPSLDPMGAHRNVATAEGIGEDGSVARDSDSWLAVIYPDPNQEPDVVITVTPRVTLVSGGPPTA